MTKKLPRHIAITCDGNRRWARERKLEIMFGHKRGVENVEKLADVAKELGVEYLTFWLLSTENREKRTEEFSYMMKLAREYTQRYKEKCLREKTRFIHIGRRDRLPKDIVAQIEDTEKLTKDFTEFTIILAIDYGGRNELIRAFKKIAEKKLPITEETVSKALDTAELPDPELLIRTGGNIRLSGIMPWAGVYSELYFTDTYFPAFGREELIEALDYYAGVQRNFGK